MENLPLHPMIVHAPLVLAVLAPLAALVIAVGIHRRKLPLRAWWVATALAAVIAVSAFAAVQTGKTEEEVVEDVVAHQPIELHEERAEAFMWASAGYFALMLGVAALASPRRRVTGGAIAVAGGVLIAGLAVLVGHSGGELVYAHGAAGAYAMSADGDRGADRVMKRHDDDDDEGRR